MFLIQEYSWYNNGKFFICHCQYDFQNKVHMYVVQHSSKYSWSTLLIRWPKHWSFSFSINPSSKYSGLISLGLTSLTSLQSKGLSKVFSNTTVQKHQFFGAQPSLWSNSHLYMTTGKTIALTIQTFVSKVMSLLFNMLSRLSQLFFQGVSVF